MLWDSSEVLALLDAEDADQAPAVRIVGDIAQDRRPNFIAEYVAVEAHALLHVGGTFSFDRHLLQFGCCRVFGIPP